MFVWEWRVEKVTVRKVEVIEVGDQSPEAVEAYVRTAFQFMPDSLRLDLIGELSRLLQKKWRGKIMQEFTEKGLYADRKGGIYPEPGGGSSLKGITRALHRAAFFAVRISRKQKIPRHSIAHLVSLSTGRHGTAGTGMWLVCCGQNCWGEKERLQLSQIRPFGALDLHGHSPEYSGYSFLPDGRYASGVWLVNPEEVWSYVMMQKDYQYRILICDRDDFAVLEMLEGRMIFPDVQSLEQFQQVQKDGGMEMI